MNSSYDFMAVVSIKMIYSQIDSQDHNRVSIARKVLKSLSGFKKFQDIFCTSKLKEKPKTAV